MSDKRRKLLIVDDEINMLTTLKFIFQENGFDVTMVSSGPEALKKIDESEYDMVLLDISMPEMDGLQTLREIKKKAPTTAVFMMTGNRESTQIKKCIEEGAITLFYKPFSVNNIIETMQQFSKKPVVLIVDDRIDDRVIMRNALEIHNYRIVEAEDGVDAVNKMQKGNFDVCIVDYKMPGMTGTEVIEKVKARDPNTNFILVSAYTLEEAIKKELEEKKGVAFIKKPFEINNLVDIIKEDKKKNK